MLCCAVSLTLSLSLSLSLCVCVMPATCVYYAPPPTPTPLSRSKRSPYLFAYYVDDLIDDVKRSGYSTYKGSVFLECILYADDIILLSGSCSGLQQMVDICANCATKSQCMTFGGNRACSSCIILNNAELTRVAKLKYFGCFFSTSGRAILILDIVHRSFMAMQF